MTLWRPLWREHRVNKKMNMKHFAGAGYIFKSTLYGLSLLRIRFRWPFNAGGFCNSVVLFFGKSCKKWRIYRRNKPLLLHFFWAAKTEIDKRYIRCLSSHSFSQEITKNIRRKKKHWRIQRTEGRCCEMILPRAPFPPPPSCCQTQHERITVGERRNSDPGNWILLPILFKLSEENAGQKTKVLQCLSEFKSRKGNFLHKTICIFLFVPINN